MSPRPKAAPKLCCPAPPRNEGKGLKVKDDDRSLAALAKALGHPARIKIVRQLAQSDACVCGDIVMELGLAQATVSQHLKVLKEAGLIRGTVSGPRTCYCLEPRALELFRAHLGGLLQ